MAELINEQEQVDLLKHWWKEYGGWLLAGILVILIAMFAWRFFAHREQQVNQLAASNYQQLLGYMEENKPEEVTATANQLMNTYPKSIYGGLAGLLLAGEQMQNNQLAAAERTLNWVIAHSEDSATLTVAKIRLARVLLAQNNPQQALMILNGVENNLLSDMVRGDSYAALHEYSQAQNQYQQALTGLNNSDPWYQVMQMKMANLPQ